MVTLAEAEVEEEEWTQRWDDATIPAAVWQQEDEEVRSTVKEMGDEASVVSRLKGSARLSGTGSPKCVRTKHHPECSDGKGLKKKKKKLLPF